MEAIAVFSLVGLGYLVNKFSGTKENFRADIGAPDELDSHYTSPFGEISSSEPNPGIKGNAFTFGYNPKPQSVSATQPNRPITATPQVVMNNQNLEGTPVYEEDIISPLTGQKISDFTHNNMVPFFGGKVRQNVGPETNNSILDNFTGSGKTQIKKQEVETMFNTQKPFGNPFGLEDASEYVQGHIELPRSKAGEKPFEPIRVGPAVGEQFGSTGKGGFQQMEINQTMMERMPKTDDIRTSDNPKLTYKTPIVPGISAIPRGTEDVGEVRKYRPDRFYIDETGKRFFVTNGEVIKDAVRPIQVMKHTSRPETMSDAVGPASSQDFQESYVSGSYRTPSAQQYGGAGFRNANMTEYYTNDTDSPESDYGKSSIDIRPNERQATSTRTMGLNVASTEGGSGMTRYSDSARPTYRGQTIGNIRQTGTPVGYAQGAPALTVISEDVARTTIREGTNLSNYLGPMSSASAPNKMKVYNPDDIARNTQKANISEKSEYFGTPASQNYRDFTSHDSAYNMRSNPNKEKVAKGRKPMSGNGGLAVFTGDVNQTTKNLNSDNVNDRANAVNRAVEIPVGVGSLGQIKYRAPLKLDVSTQRNTREMFSSVQDNPLFSTQNINKNAEIDEQHYQEMLKGM